MTKLVFISDTHTKHDEVTIPPCDILAHTGDWTFKGTYSEVSAFAKWLEKQPACHIVVVPGNHEKSFEQSLPTSRSWITDHCPRANILIHEPLEIEGIKFFGTPWTPAFGYGWAWNAGRTPVEAAHLFKPFIGDLWNDIPLDTQVLLSHGPGLGTLDWVADYRTGKIINVGCHELTKKIADLNALKIHGFGHLHFKGGYVLEQDGVKYVNAANCDDSYKIRNSVITIDL